MSDLATIARRHQADVDLGHPVRSFTLAMVAIGLLLLGLRWTGVVDPQVTSPSSGWMESGPAQQFAVHLRNDSALDVRVTDVTWPTRNVTTAAIFLGPEDDPGVPGRRVAPFSPFTLGRGESRVVSITLVPRCFATLGDLEVDVRTAIGVTRTLHFEPSSHEVHGGC